MSTEHTPAQQPHEPATANPTLGGTAGPAPEQQFAAQTPQQSDPQAPYQQPFAHQQQPYQQPLAHQPDQQQPHEQQRPPKPSPRTGPIVWGALILVFCAYVLVLASGGSVDPVAWLITTILGLGVLLLGVGIAVLVRSSRNRL